MSALVGRRTLFARVAMIALVVVVCAFACPMFAFAATPEGSVAYDNAPVILIVTAAIAVVVALVYEGVHRRKKRHDEEEKESSHKDD